MSKIKVNTIENVSGTKKIELDNQPIYPLSINWNGIILTESTVPKLSEIGIVGDNQEAKIYPDGTIIGKSDNGNFIKYANGILECFGTTPLLTTNTAYGLLSTSANLIVYMPILFISTVLSLYCSRVEEVNYYGFANIEPVGTDRANIKSYSNGGTGQGKVSWSIKGRWK